MIFLYESTIVLREGYKMNDYELKLRKLETEIKILKFKTDCLLRVSGISKSELSDYALNQLNASDISQTDPELYLVLLKLVNKNGI